MLHPFTLGLVLKRFDEVVLDRTRHFYEPRIVVVLMKGHMQSRHGISQVWQGERVSY